MDIYEKLKELGLELPDPGAPVGMFKPVKQVGNLLYVSGQGSYFNDDWIKGKAGSEVSVERAQLGAKYCMLNTLAALHAYLGDLNKIKGVVKLLGFVNGDPDFGEQPKVINGASQLCIDLFGEEGRHARSAVGMGSLPMGIVCEVESIFELKE